MGHPRRHYYDEQQNLLYTSQGYARKNLEDPTDVNFFGPRDNFNSRFRLRVYSLPGQLLQDIAESACCLTLADQHLFIANLTRAFDLRN